MAAVTAEQLITVRIHDDTGHMTEGLVEAGEVLYAGTLAFYDADGFVTPTAGGLLFAGVVRKTADNSGGADGDIKCELYTEGDFELPMASAAQADLTPGLAYATDNYTVTTTATSNSFIGTIKRIVSSSKVEVRLDTTARPDAIA